MKQSTAPTVHSYIDHSHKRGVSLVRVSPLADWYVVQQRRVHGHFTRRTSQSTNFCLTQGQSTLKFPHMGMVYSNFTMGKMKFTQFPNGLIDLLFRDELK